MKVHVFQLFSTIKVNLVAKIKQSAYVCVIFHVKYKKNIIFALISHNDLQTSISNLGSFRNIGRLWKMKLLRAALKLLATDKSTSDTCSAHKFSYFLMFFIFGGV